MSAVWGMTLRGVEALRVEVEVEMTGGLFVMTLVGLPDVAVREARERVRAALRSLDIPLRGRIAINLAPADVPKEGALLDLPIAVGLAVQGGVVPPPEGALFLGELALDGRLRRVRGAVSGAILARDLGVPLYVPRENGKEVSLVDGVEAYGVPDLASLFRHLRKEAPLLPLERENPAMEVPFVPEVDLQEIKGQAQAKRALEIAAAGHHNLFLVGAPGSGKSMLAKALRGILPSLSREELLEVHRIRSTLGLPFDGSTLPPFRCVHHTATTPAVCGGGSRMQPGEISLAHRGVLFLDEMPEFRRELLEAMRQPLEDGSIAVNRASGSVTYPSRVLLVCAANPCACGYYGDPKIPCRCSASERRRYAKRLSGPILDRVDLHVAVPRLTPEELLSDEESSRENSRAVRERVLEARDRQRARWRPFGYSCNAEVPERLLRKNIRIGTRERNFLREAARKHVLTGRGMTRLLRVVRTIGDLRGEEELSLDMFAEALGYRKDGNSWMNV
ncbi:MAG TPA: YifB family Mg chelatase-like AAA ATPase [Synergistaceae bacterium]|nr:YifB family Mg chelatase-like AAA ATPase [Synergistaceae bacterium]